MVQDMQVTPTGWFQPVWVVLSDGSPQGHGCLGERAMASDPRWLRRAEWDFRLCSAPHRTSIGAPKCSAEALGAPRHAIPTGLAAVWVGARPACSTFASFWLKRLNLGRGAAIKRPNAGGRPELRAYSRGLSWSESHRQPELRAKKQEKDRERGMRRRLDDETNILTYLTHLAS